MIRKLSAIALLLAATSTLAEPVRDGPVEAELISEYDAIPAGTNFWVAVKLKMDPGWHTYWKNPGDTGKETGIQWLLPPGLEAGPVLWPVPEKIAASPSWSYGYHNEVLLLVPMRASADLKAGDMSMVAARVRWLACKESCLNGVADVNAYWKVIASPERHPGNAYAIADTLKRLPRKDEGWKFFATADTERILLRIQHESLLGGEVQDLYFFPDALEVIDHSAPQQWTKTESGVTLSLKKSPYTQSLPDMLKGVLKVNHDAENAIVVEVKLEKQYQ